MMHCKDYIIWLKFVWCRCLVSVAVMWPEYHWISDYNIFSDTYMFLERTCWPLWWFSGGQEVVPYINIDNCQHICICRNVDMHFHERTLVYKTVDNPYLSVLWFPFAQTLLLNIVSINIITWLFWNVFLDCYQK